MKRRGDPRHKIRVARVKALFKYSFQPKKSQPPEGVEEIAKNLEEIDRLIEKNAPAWPVNQLAVIDLAILRLAVYELAFKQDTAPYKVIVDEAVEIAKEYGNKSSASFINGVLGSIIKKLKIDKKNG